jgi:hypothetical protein
VDLRAGIGDLRRRVQVWIDADRVLPADGSSLMAALDRALEGLAGEDASAVRAGIETFAVQVQALIEARMLEPGDGHPPIETATTLVALLPGASETDLETHGWMGDAVRAESCPAAEPSLPRCRDGHRPALEERNSRR